MNGRNYLADLDKMQDRYDSGKESEWFAQFGDGYKAVENAVRYEQLLRCGYSHGQAMTYDEYGWIRTNYSKPSKCRKELVAKTNSARCDMLTFQLPNRKWIAGYELAYSSGGSYCGCSYYDKQFDTERQAKHAELVQIIQVIEKSWEKDPKVLLPQLKRAAMLCLQMELF